MSLETQQAKIEAARQIHEFVLVKTVVEASSAKSMRSEDRPVLAAALAALRAGEADGIIVVKLDRLTRSVRDLGSLLEDYFGSKGYELLSLSDSIDTTSASGRLALNVLVSVAQWEREAIGERTSEVLKHLKKEGVVLGGAGLGWRRREVVKGERMVVESVPEEEETMRRIFELYDGGHTLRDVSEILEREGRRAKKGGVRWYPTQVARVLRRRVA